MLHPAVAGVPWGIQQEIGRGAGVIPAQLVAMATTGVKRWVKGLWTGHRRYTIHIEKCQEGYLPNCWWQSSLRSRILYSLHYAFLNSWTFFIKVYNFCKKRKAISKEEIIAFDFLVLQMSEIMFGAGLMDSWLGAVCSVSTVLQPCQPWECKGCCLHSCSSGWTMNRPGGADPWGAKMMGQDVQIQTIATHPCPQPSGNCYSECHHQVVLLELELHYYRSISPGGRSWVFLGSALGINTCEVWMKQIDAGLWTGIKSQGIRWSHQDLQAVGTRELTLYPALTNHCIVCTFVVIAKNILQNLRS